ncbi:hypothetical protein H8D36_03805 [archaeon]|nr:hypothetical protein [archaeon]MBL7056948.1 hypothetical protein [Candidatus Woesearchaeota archaeon]
MAKKQTSTKKIKKKKWYPVIGPKIFGSRVLGESLLADPSVMKGRYMTMNLSNVIGDPRKQNTNVQFKIKDVREGQGITEITKYELIPSFMKRLVRRGRNKIDDSFIVKSADGKRLRVKIIVITNSYAFKSIETKLRLNIRKILKETLNKNTFEKTIEDLLRISLQKDMKSKLAKIFPVRVFEIRVLKIEKRKRDFEEEVEVVPEAEVEKIKANETTPTEGGEAEATEEKKEISETKVSDDAQKPKVSDTPKVEEKKEEVKVEEKKEEVKTETSKPVEKKTEKKAVKKVAPKKETKKTPVKKTSKK